MREEPKMIENIQTGHRNFLMDAAYFLYVENRKASAEAWFKYLKQKYPAASLYKPVAPIAPMSLDEYAVARVTEEVGDTSVDKTKAVIEGLLTTAFYNLAIGEDDQFNGLSLLAQRIWNRFQTKIAGGEQRVGLPELGLLKRETLDRLVDPKRGLSPLLVAQLRTKLNLPVSTNAPPSQ